MPNHNQIDWTVASSINVANYQLERSYDAEYFELLGEQPAQQNNQTQQYQFIDPDPRPGLTYYRLSEQNMDGRREIIALDVLDRNSATHIYPSIVADFLTVHMHHASTATLYNVVGSQTMHFDFIAGRNQVSLAHLPTGIYMLQFASGQTKKILVD